MTVVKWLVDRLQVVEGDTAELLRSELINATNAHLTVLKREVMPALAQCHDERARAACDALASMLSLCEACLADFVAAPDASPPHGSLAPLKRRIEGLSAIEAAPLEQAFADCMTPGEADMVGSAVEVALQHFGGERAPPLSR